MQVALRQDSADFDDLLTFVDDFGIGDAVELIKPEASSPIDLSDSVWLDGLDELFRDTSPPQKPAPVVINKKATVNRSGVSIVEKSTKEAKALTLPAAAPATKTTRKNSGRPRVSRKKNSSICA